MEKGFPLLASDFDLHFSPLSEEDQSGDHPLPVAWQEAFLAAHTSAELVGRLWEPILVRARGFVFRLEAITHEIQIGRSAGGVPQGILYVSHAYPRPGGWFGGIPASEKDIHNAEGFIGRPLPTSYREFSRIHNGFFQLQQDGCAFLPLHLLHRNVSQEIVEEGIGSRNDISEIEWWLRFFVGAGGATGYFDLAQPSAGGDYRTILIDAASKATLPPKSFWSFLKDFTIREFTP